MDTVDYILIALVIILLYLILRKSNFSPKANLIAQSRDQIQSVDFGYPDFQKIVPNTDATEYYAIKNLLFNKPDASIVDINNALQ